ncbi:MULTISPECIES: cupredoxin family protein [unclassified Ruegeria]|jgi:uncharacterized cupredoxin-like copper-binding protein|uniref:cupredoxin domain-containing protein n=1 Tax=unclassified Ruegeria TaxID=2625375 RepID=UPI0014913E5F|nr:MULTISPECIES: cupredoxin family protein [unclassified Ruegeria]MBO9448155.1 cupredoxin family protein [Ruegeria sp. R14_0]NOD90850.1 copper oxidase [Ruegeria sp. HKCCD4318]NOE16023.1 copper oxidase [Ruegeria sp. HKCCD4318-2]NOG11724.1 cupredoxin family protein [Ruegeria sp. HKCCD4315]UUV08568.1 cupredoxin family protein [Ruegeria sp. YS9]
MKTTILGASIAALLATPLFASENQHEEHGENHDDSHAEMMQVGQPGKSSDIGRTVKVSMKETDDGDMIFEPSNLSFKKGQTIEFDIKNLGELEHEFILDTAERNKIHKDVMVNGSQRHVSENAVSLEPGEQSKLIWTFSNDGSFEFACLIPGHYESGMFGNVTVQ